MILCTYAEIVNKGGSFLDAQSKTFHSLTDQKSHVSIILASGAVAQLGARVNGIHEVAGSIPASSTTLRSLSFGWQATGKERDEA